MRFILTIFAVLVLAGGCASVDSPQASKDDPAAVVYGKGTAGDVPILVPGRNIPVK